MATEQWPSEIRFVKSYQAQQGNIIPFELVASHAPTVPVPIQNAQVPVAYPSPEDTKDSLEAPSWVKEFVAQWEPGRQGYVQTDTGQWVRIQTIPSQAGLFGGMDWKTMGLIAIAIIVLNSTIGKKKSKK